MQINQNGVVSWLAAWAISICLGLSACGGGGGSVVGGVSSSVASVPSSSSSSSSSSLSACDLSVGGHVRTTQTCWHESFVATDVLTFTSTLYASASNGLPLYYLVSGLSSLSFSGGQMDISPLTGGARFLVGGIGFAVLPSSSLSPGNEGVFNLSDKKCKLVVRSMNPQAGGAFQVFVNNNTTGSANSPLGSASRVVDASFTGPDVPLVAGENVYNFSVGPTSGKDYLQLRTVSGTGSLMLDEVRLDCVPASSP